MQVFHTQRQLQTVNDGSTIDIIIISVLSKQTLQYAWQEDENGWSYIKAITYTPPIPISKESLHQLKAYL